jgi:natural resistance-associated macrophage protein
MGFLIQMLSAKLGMVTGKDLAQLCRTHLPVFPRLALWAATELAIIATDMIEVIGGAVALRTLSSGAIPLWAGVLITAAGGFAVLALERWGMRLLEAVLGTSCTASLFWLSIDKCQNL